MSPHDYALDEFQEYEAIFDPLRNDRKAHRRRKPRSKPQARRTRRAIVSELADPTNVEAGFDTTYRPGRYEEGWLRDSIRAFFEEGLITDVLAQIKGGKEASVYLCSADLATGVDLLVAKVYRPRQFRNLRNDKVYRQGREVLLGSGGTVKKSDHREMRALGKKTAFGLRLRHTSWLMYEYQTLGRLYKAGAAVPRPWSSSGNAILMEYIGDERAAAPTMNQIALEPDEVEPLFREVLRNIDLLLQHDLIHGDLSAYNLLYWQGNITLIDFPQVINMFVNQEAYDILLRDIRRVCEYFQKQGFSCDPHAILDELWERYTGQQGPIPLDIPAELWPEQEE